MCVCVAWGQLSVQWIAVHTVMNITSSADRCLTLIPTVCVLSVCCFLYVRLACSLSIHLPPSLLPSPPSSGQRWNNRKAREKGKLHRELEWKEQKKKERDWQRQIDGRWHNESLCCRCSSWVTSPYSYHGNPACHQPTTFNSFSLILVFPSVCGPLKMPGRRNMTSVCVRCHNSSWHNLLALLSVPSLSNILSPGSP